MRLSAPIKARAAARSSVTQSPQIPENLERTGACWAATGRVSKQNVPAATIQRRSPCVTRAPPTSRVSSRQRGQIFVGFLGNREPGEKVERIVEPVGDAPRERRIGFFRSGNLKRGGG